MKFIHRENINDWKMNQIRKNISIVLIFISALLLTRCDGFFGQDEPDVGFYDAEVVSIAKYVLDSANMFTKFSRLLVETDLTDALDSYNPDGNNFTLFLPTDEAIDQFIVQSDYANFEELLADRDYSNVLARYHIVLTELSVNDFPFGALPDTTASGDYLTIGMGFGTDPETNEILFDSTVYRVNNEAPIIGPNIKMINGTIHVISRMLEPVVFNGYEWLKSQEGFEIITEIFEITGLRDTMGLYVTGREGRLIENNYTLLIEHDSIYHKNNIYTSQELIDYIVKDPERIDYTSKNNPLYQFAAYHIMENRYFLDAMETSNYNTFANYPVNIQSGLDLLVNRGSKVYDTVLQGVDTLLIDYATILYTVSNVLMKNGAIHFVDQILELYLPKPSAVTFQFTNEEPMLNRIRNEVGEHYFYTDNDFTALKWEGVNEMIYVKSGDASEQANSKDYLSFNGDFRVYYSIPKVMAGNYRVIVRANSNSFQNATIQVFIDGKRIGSSFDLSSGGNPYRWINAGKVSFTTTREHEVEIRALIPGLFHWDFIRFEP
jgi:uncharacterized surface protein with fasciclin (FAS1) repeats